MTDLSKAKIIAKRQNKTVYRDGGFTVKLMDEKYPAPDVLNEALNLSIVHETGFLAPELSEVTKIDGKWAIIYEYIEGVTLASMIEEDPDKADEYFKRFVKIHLRMHSYKAERLRHHTDKMHAKISASGLAREARHELHMRLNGMPKHNKLCHGDFTPGNVIITPSGSEYVIDWAHATQGNASADAARTYLRFKLAGNDAYAEKYIDLFCEMSGTEKRYVQKWLALAAASQLVKNKPEERELLLSWANIFDYDS